MVYAYWWWCWHFMWAWLTTVCPCGRSQGIYTPGPCDNSQDMVKWKSDKENPLAGKSSSGQQWSDKVGGFLVLVAQRRRVWFGEPPFDMLERREFEIHTLGAWEHLAQREPMVAAWCERLACWWEEEPLAQWERMACWKHLVQRKLGWVFLQDSYIFLQDSFWRGFKWRNAVSFVFVPNRPAQKFLSFCEGTIFC